MSEKSRWRGEKGIPLATSETQGVKSAPITEAEMAILAAARYIAVAGLDIRKGTVPEGCGPLLGGEVISFDFKFIPGMGVGLNRRLHPDEYLSVLWRRTSDNGEGKDIQVLARIDGGQAGKSLAGELGVIINRIRSGM